MFLVSVTQPIIIGCFAIIGLGRSTSWVSIFEVHSSIRSKIGNFRFYECATYSRLNSILRVNFSFFSILLLFLIYDVDLMFFLTESLFLHNYGFIDYVIFSFLVLLIVIGLGLDLKFFGFSWKIS